MGLCLGLFVYAREMIKHNEELVYVQAFLESDILGIWVANYWYCLILLWSGVGQGCVKSVMRSENKKAIS